MDLWISPELCSGCAACSNICPRDAITLKYDEHGYEVPSVDNTSCVDCGLCKKVCPVLKCVEGQALSTEPKAEEPDIYAAWSKTYNTRYNSTSGGVFSELAKVVIDEGGYICGAVYDENQMVHHVVANTMEGLEKIRQSKYIQSSIRFVYREIKKLLKEGQKVLFCGAPCQVAALYEFLGGDHENLITADFICRGVNSPMAYRAWLDDLEEEYGAKASRVWFKNKELGWNKFSTRVDFENGRVYRKSRYEDLFMRGYLERNLFIRPSCTNCQFKGMPRPGDVTLADFWKIDKALDADLGTSMIILNSEKGEALFEKTRPRLSAHKRTYGEALEGNACLVSSVNTGRCSEKFFELLKEGKKYSDAFRLATGDTPLVSVVVVVDRNNSRLEEAIATICEQEYAKLEILLVCVGDNKALQQRVKDIAATSEKITLLDPALNVACAHNVAVQMSKGEYIHFCTGQELLYPDFYTAAINQLLEKRAEIIAFGWDDHRKVGVCRSAFNGTGNHQALFELITVPANVSSGYSGYGPALWNKIFRRDLIITEESQVLFNPYGYGLTNLFWLLKVAFTCHKAVFDSASLMRRFGGEAEPKLLSTMALTEFFEEENDVLQMMTGVEGVAYEEVRRLCFDYEIGLLASGQAKELPQMSDRVMEHIVEYYGVVLSEQDVANCLIRTKKDAKDHVFLKTKISGLEKDRTFLKNKSARLEKDREFLRNKSARFEKDREFLRNKSERLEKDKKFLAIKMANLEKDRTWLKKKVSNLEGKQKELEKELNEYKNSKVIRMAMKVHRLGGRIVRFIKRK